MENHPALPRLAAGPALDGTTRPERHGTVGAVGQDPLREAAQSFEAAFLAEMLAHAGLGASRASESTFGGGIGGGGPGEEAFSSLLTRAWADKMAEQGGIGLSERLFQSLAERNGRDV